MTQLRAKGQRVAEIRAKCFNGLGKSQVALKSEGLGPAQKPRGKVNLWWRKA
jgi:hypothetical protein